MKALWAPWRMEYVVSEGSSDGCVFCPGDDRSLDKERLILHVDHKTLVVMNKYPYINGHLLVAPVRHVGTLEELSDEELLHLMTLVRSSVEVLKKHMGPDGFNVGLNLGRVAGAGLEDHVHFHVVPRWSGDTNFMAVFGEVRVIPQHIRETFNELRPYFEHLDRQVALHPGGHV